VSFLVGLRTYQHPLVYAIAICHQCRWIVGKWKMVGGTGSGTWCWGWWTFGFVEPPQNTVTPSLTGGASHLPVGQIFFILFGHKSLSKSVKAWYRNEHMHWNTDEEYFPWLVGHKGTRSGNQALPTSGIRRPSVCNVCPMRCIVLNSRANPINRRPPV